MTSPPTTTSRPRALQLLVAFVTALLLPVALTGASLSTVDHHPQHTSWTVQVGNQSRNAAIQGMRYLPSDVYINAGDSVHWRANSLEPHTVTFLGKGQTLDQFQPFDPTNPKETQRVGSHRYDGTSYYNSGLLSTSTEPEAGLSFTQDYRLKFPRPGDYTYYCLIHGSVQKGTVHVRAEGTRYPYTQAQYDRQARVEAALIVRHGFRLWHDTAKLATNHRVLEGNDDGLAMVMRFIRPTVTIRAGEKVDFENIGMGAPHTVTFGKEPVDFTKPSGDPAHYRGGDLNSGIQPPGSKFTVRFEKPGVYHYICALHDFMGMVGKVVVVGHHT